MKIDVVIENLKSMMKERGDIIDGLEDMESKKDRFFQDKDVLCFETSTTVIVFALTKDLMSLFMKDIVFANKNSDTEKLIEKYSKKQNIILIINDDVLTSQNKKQMKDFDELLQKHTGTFQYFHVRNLLYDPTKHKLVPKHIKLTSEEVMEMMEKYILQNKSQLPYILQDDAIARWIGLRTGDVVRIERYNNNSGLSFYYRVCVPCKV